MKNIPFKERFIPGDIICSDKFRNGLCMVVEEFTSFQWKSGRSEDYYRCIDLLSDDEIDPQGWCAHEFDTFKTDPYNWRIAEDEDIVKHLLTSFYPLQHEHNQMVLTITEDFFTVSGKNRDSVFFNKDEARVLRDKLNEWIVDS